MNIKQKIRYLYNFLTYKINKSERPPILVASMGRSGSTFLFSSIISSLARERFPFLPLFIGRTLCNGTMWYQGNKLFKGYVHKTHCLANQFSVKNPCKIIYTFSRPSDSVLSVITRKEKYGFRWISEHFHNLQAKGKYEELPFSDILRISENLYGWINKKDVSLLIIRYEKIWEYQSEIEDFLSLKLNLPKFRERKKHSKEAENLKKTIRNTYYELDLAVSKLPDIQIFQ